MSDLEAHLATGLTTVARCWGIERSDGARFGFTDHDCDLSFEGFTFRADSGLTALALSQTTGLAVDNTEGLGALSDVAISEADIEAGRFDGAEVLCWLVNWADVAARRVLFRGEIGELHRADGAFRAELRGLSTALNQPMGRAYQKTMAAGAPDLGFGFDPDTAGYHELRDVEEVEEGRLFRFSDMAGFEEGWFTHGRLRLLSGDAIGLVGAIKRDETLPDGRREIALWEPIRAEIAPGDALRLDAGFDGRFETCRLKFASAADFRGFPDIPGEDWLTSYPSAGGSHTGGSLRG
ncbi:MAG: DUF2163 domain-containing protein [Rhodobacteraceae bacterium]|nr:DUF2163 domain-containing protein [Paracoccaceae bacterium]